MNAPLQTAVDWPLAVHQSLSRLGFSVVGFVPDAGHKRLIELCQADARMRTVVLSTEEEGVALLAGAWLGGEKGVLLMQSSGVGNCINMLGLPATGRFPLLMLVTMRGEPGETNPAQIPMGSAAGRLLEAMKLRVSRAERAEAVAGLVAAALERAYADESTEAVLIAQAVLGFKAFK